MEKRNYLYLLLLGLGFLAGLQACGSGGNNPVNPSPLPPTATVTNTITACGYPGLTCTPTGTPTPTDTPTITLTPTITATPTITSTPTITATATPTATIPTNTSITIVVSGSFMYNPSAVTIIHGGAVTFVNSTST